MAEQNLYYGVGRRKEAIARVRLLKGEGVLLVNNQKITDYFKRAGNDKRYQKPFEVTSTWGKYHGSIKVSGGGFSSQLEAIILGISRALTKVEGSFKGDLKKYGLLTRDARVKERRKYGLAQKARAKKQSPKR